MTALRLGNYGAGTVYFPYVMSHHILVGPYWETCIKLSRDKF